MQIVNIKFSLEGISLRCLRETLDAVLTHEGVKRELRADLALVVTEYLSNLLRHANGYGHLLEFAVFKSVCGLTLRIADKTSFNWMLNKQTAKVHSADTSLQEHGMGIGLIQRLSPNFCYQRAAGVNRFTVVLPHSVIHWRNNKINRPI